VRHARGRHQLQHAIEKADAGSQDRREHELFAGDHRRLHGLQRRFDVDHFERQIARDLVAEQHPDLVQELAEALGRARLVAHQRQLVLDEGVGEDVNVAHGASSGRKR
jgi:hypothetical protein